MKPKIYVVGAGPAGLSAAVRLLEKSRGRVDVELVSMAPVLGGKAATWKEDGFVVEHGFHAVFGFYDAMIDLAERAGVDVDDALVSNHGTSHMLVDDVVHEFKLARNPLVNLARHAKIPGLTRSENAQFRRASLRLARTVRRTKSLEQLDNVCFRALLLEHGAPPVLIKHPFYRQAQELIFNAPYDVSAYIVMHGAELMRRSYADSLYYYINGGLTDRFWQPIADYVEKLGGTLTLNRKLVGLDIRGGRVQKLRFAPVDPDRWDQGGDVVDTVGPAEDLDQFASVVSTIPAANFVELMDDGQTAWQHRYFRQIRNLRSVSTLSLQLWLKDPLPNPRPGMINGMPLPFSYGVDYKEFIPRYGRDTRFGAALEFVGAEAGWEDTPDDEIVERARRHLDQVPGYEGVADGAVVKRVFRRNTANHERYLLTDPGTLRFRPPVKSPLPNLFLAGDWVRCEVDIPTMESAIRSGRDAADAALEAL